MISSIKKFFKRCFENQVQRDTKELGNSIKEFHFTCDDLEKELQELNLMLDELIIEKMKKSSKCKKHLTIKMPRNFTK